MEGVFEFDGDLVVEVLIDGVGEVVTEIDPEVVVVKLLEEDWDEEDVLVID